MEAQKKSVSWVARFVLGALVFFGLYLTSRHNYVLFHYLSEVFSVLVAFGVFVVAWNSRRYMGNRYFLFIGVSFLYIGVIDVVHTFAYKGMDVFPGYGADLPTQLWIASRYIQSFSLLAAPLFVSRKLDGKKALLGFGALALLAVASIFLGMFPDCYVEGEGLTPFKKTSEYVISLIFVLSVVALRKRRDAFDTSVYRTIVVAISAMILSELSFTAYVSVYGIFNMIGHSLKILAYFLFYAAIIETGFKKPYDILFRDLKRSEESLGEALGESQQRRAETTALLNASRAVLEHRDFEGAARAIFEYSRDLLGAQAGYISLLSADWSANDAVFIDSGGLPCNVDPSIPMPIRGMRAEAYRIGSTVVENDFPRSEWAGLLPEGHSSIRNALFAPLKVEGRVVGLLGLSNKPGGFSFEDSMMASAFADIAAVALTNSRSIDALENSEERFRSVAQSASDAVINIDAAGKVVFWNSAAEHIFGYPSEEVVGRDVSLVIPDGYVGPHMSGLRRAVDAGGATGRTGAFELVARRKGGEEFPVEFSLSSWKTREGVFFTGIVRDITERKRVEEAVRESEAKYRSLFSNMLEGFAYHWVVLDEVGRPVDYEFLEVNDSFERMTGLKRQDVVGRRVTEVIPGIRESGFDWIGAFGNVALTGSEMRTEQYFEVLGRWYSVSAYSPARGYFVAVFKDITGRKRAEEELRAAKGLLERLFSITHFLLAYLDRDFNLIRVNDAYAAADGKTPEYYVGKNHFSLFPDDENERIFREVLETGEPYSVSAKPFEYAHNPERGVRYWDWTLMPVKDPTGRVEGLVLSLADVTERVRAVEAVKASLREKEMLIKEIHHRMKNNLMVVTSLLKLQSTQVRDNEARELFKVSQNRVRAMSMIHERLYRSTDLSSIDFGEYVNSLAVQLFHTYEVDASRVRLRISAEPVHLDIDTVIPCGLILNELISNSLKYAFPGGSGGEISIGVSKGPDGTCILSVVDTGAGIPPGLDIYRTKSLGLQLVTALTKQINGRLDLVREGGTEFKVTFSERRFERSVSV